MSTRRSRSLYLAMEETFAFEDSQQIHEVEVRLTNPNKHEPDVVRADFRSGRLVAPVDTIEKVGKLLIAYARALRESLDGEV